jgi:hypothetical protein
VVGTVQMAGWVVRIEVLERHWRALPSGVLMR